MTNGLENKVEEPKEEDQKEPIAEKIKKTIFTQWKPDERFTSPFIGLVEVPQGHRMVKYKLGQTDGFRIPIISSLKEILTMSKGGSPKEARIFKGQVKKPGIRLLIGLGGLYASGVVNNTQLRSVDYNTKPDQTLVTDDGVELLRVDYTVNWRVIDPMIAITEIEDYKGALREITESRVRRAIGSFSFNDLSRVSTEIMGPYDTGKEISGKKIGWGDINDEYKLKEDFGISIEKMILTQFDLPDELRNAMSASAQANAKANGMRKIADAQGYIAQKRAEAAELYKDNPDALKIAYMEMIKEMSESGKATFYNIPNFEEFLKGKMFGN